MNVTDIVILALGSFFVIRGFFKGLSGEFFSLLGIIGGFYCSLAFYSPVASFLSQQFGISTLASSAIAMLAIFFLIFAACALCEKGTKKIIEGTSLTWFDKSCGAIAGFLKIYLVSLVLLVSGMLMSPVAGDAWVGESKALVATAKTWPYVYPALDRLGVLPDLSELQREAKEYIMRQASQKLFEMPATVSADTIPNPENTENTGLLNFFLNWGKD